MNPIPAMFQYVKKLVGADDEKQVAFAPLTTPFTNEDFLFLNSEVYQKDPAKYYAEALEFSQKANSIIKKPNIWEIETKDFLYVNFDMVLSRARLIEDRSLTDEELALQDDARKILYENDNTPTAAFLSYKTYQQQYNDIAKKIGDHNNSKPSAPGNDLDAWNTENQNLVNELKAKALDWSALGFKDQIEKAMHAFDKPRENSDREEFAARWHDARTFMDTIKSTSATSGSEIFPMDCIPNNLYVYRGVPWTKVDLTRDEMNSLTDELKQDSGGISVDLMFGDDIDLDSISFEICRVVLNRSWFFENLLNSRYWNFPDGIVATGEKDNYNGLIPAYPIEFILVKDVNPTLTANSPVNETLKNNLKAGLPVFMGPFLLKNNISGNAMNSSVRVQTFTNNQLHIINQSFKTVATPATLTAAAVTPAPAAAAFKVKKDIQFLGHLGAVKDVGGVIVHDHSHLPGDGVMHPQDHAGFVWVVDHWERQRATDLNRVKISGKTADENNQVLPDVEITLISAASPVIQNDLTDLNGQYTIENIAKGNYHLTAQKDGYSTVEKELVVSADLDAGTINLSSKNPVESFLLLGVVYRKLPALPNPIPNEVYS